ncbi:hypothetical protein HPB51_020156 [Rhipicephalus microplus]|uniref:Uncharacterized protein n=1 Tax=Rhipicephalus microplus TaxID=6941 RepID=A0A9J6F5U1_RHIMP|nr:hypothetical protein HPB51_020156 [Rhipicephalus microplus]
MLISYCHTFDLFALGRRFYFYIACVSYGLGMVATFLALELMRNAQPALLYLVPFTIIPTITTAWSKGDLFAIWNGVKARMPPMVASPRDEPGISRDRNLTFQEGSSVGVGDSHGAANSMEAGASSYGADNLNFTEGAERAGAVLALPRHPSAAGFGCDECPTTEVLPASRKRFPRNLGYIPWEYRSVLGQHRRNGLRQHASDGHATGPSTA